jgi:hypothetical protein
MVNGAQGTPTTINPLSFLREAISAVPAVRFALGVGGIAAVIAIVAGFLDLRIALVGIPIVFIFMIILLIVSRLAGEVPALQLAIAVLVWFSILFMVLATLLFAVTFFVRADTLHTWGLNSFYELFNVPPVNSPNAAAH